MCKTIASVALLVTFSLPQHAVAGIVLNPLENQAAGSGQNAIVSSNTGTSSLDGMSINTAVGAQRFYQEGYTGTRAVVGIVEGGHVWNGHETLGKVTSFFDARPTYAARGVSAGALGEFSRHATWVAHAAAGSGLGNEEYKKGIAHGAEIWSGAIATDWFGTPYTGNWGWSRGYAFTDAYAGMALNGTNGRRVDVVNSSWGFSDPNNRPLSGGNNIFTVTLDGIAKASRAVFVAIAGNEGADAAMRSPGNGYNGITVGALGNDLDNPPYSKIASFSSRGPQDYNGPDGFFSKVRAVVDIVAPGSNLSLAFYGGTTGGNRGGTDPSAGAIDQYSSNMQGTSFASPIVAGGASLLVDVAYDRFAANIDNARDGQVIKAVLLNSAAKPAGWNNGQAAVNGAITTSQALDYSFGAGMMDLDAAFDQFTAGTTDIVGLDGGSIQEVGWDYGVVSEGLANDYLFADSLLAGTEFTATLTWFVGREWEDTGLGGGITSTDDYFTDLSLQLWSLEAGGLDSLIAISDAAFINTEHFSFLLPETDEYLLRVAWEGERYDFSGNTSQTYGLAWSAIAVPEPSACSLLSACALCLLRRRRVLS